MELEYNGVRMELVTLNTVKRDAVFSSDGADLLYIRWNVGATCVYSPGGYPVGTAVTSLSKDASDYLYDRQGGPVLVAGNGLRGRNPVLPGVTQTGNANNQGKGGYNAAMTDVELRSRLMLPRRKLLIHTWDDQGRPIVWLQSPKDGYTSDLTGGPTVHALDVISVQGEGQTMGLYFQVETAVSPCPDGSDRVILSHRWEMDHVPDENHYLTRVIKGEVIFNAALMDNSPYTPDHFRNQFMHPIPLGFKRRGPTVTQSSDGFTIRYVIEDVNPTITFDPGDSGATNIEIVETIKYAQPQRIF